MGGSGGVTPAGQQYCLKWNNHQNNLLRVFSRLLGQEQFTDVVVAAEGRHVKCHKVSNVNGGLNLIFFSFQMILSACSSYFEQLFINFNEPHQVVILKDTSFADIVAIVEFMYKGEINVSQVNLRQLAAFIANLAIVPTHMGQGSPPKSIVLLRQNQRLHLWSKCLHHIMWILIDANFCCQILRAPGQSWLKF